MNRPQNSSPCAEHEAPATDSGEAGFMLVAVIAMVALVLLTLAVAAPVIAKQLQRDKEVESEHRAQQYVRAIRLYYRKFNTYPPSIDALKQSNNIRFLRQEYIDPLTGKADWRLLHQGQQKTTIKVFFGQELGGIGASGLGSAAGLASGAPTGATSSTSTIGATSPAAAGFQDATITTSSGAVGASGSTGGFGGFGSGTSGGGPIVGVGTAATGNSIATPDQQKTYETWEFWYDPRIEQLYQKGHMNGGTGSGALSSQTASSFGSSLSGQSNSQSGSAFGSSSFGTSSFGSGQSTSGFGSTNTSTPPTTTTPTPQ